MSNKEAIRQHQRAFLSEVKSRKEPVFYTIQGIEIKVNPCVFPPASDTKLLAQNIKTSPGERILDLTTGSGVFAVVAGLQGATGVAIDVNPEAVRNAEENFREHGVNMRAICSDLFENIPEEKFDHIFANGPFFEGDITEALDRACYGAKDFIERLFSGVKAFLKPNGEILIVIVEGADLKHFESTIKENGFNFDIIDKRSSRDKQRVYRLYVVILASSTRTSYAKAQ